MSTLVRLPLAGTVLEIKDGCVCGDDKDPVRPVGVDLGNVAWKLVSLDLETKTCLIEITAADVKSVEVATDTWETQPMTKEEKAKVETDAKAFESIPHEQLFALTSDKPISIKAIADEISEDI